MPDNQLAFYEFFAGGGMVRAGLGPDWTCLFANDFDTKKADTYTENWGDSEFKCDDINNLSSSDLPGKADLMWGSFPCQDLSLAGVGAGLKGNRSGTFWSFIDHIYKLRAEGRQPTIVALENVMGTLTSHGGEDFVAICDALNNLDYRFGALVVDASHFVPQSRPRLFIIAVKGSGEIPLISRDEPINPWHPKTLIESYNRLPEHVASNWIWWSLPLPKSREIDFIDIIEHNAHCVKWHSKAETDSLLSMMSQVNLEKVEQAKMKSYPVVGGVYKRTRYENGIKIQRAEVRFDKVAGCLRTPAGGSSRQLLLYVHGDVVRSRLISARETARLMGLPDSYKLPSVYNEAYHLTGDGVVVDVVKYLSQHIFKPYLYGPIYGYTTGEAA